MSLRIHRQLVNGQLSRDNAYISIKQCLIAFGVNLASTQFCPQIHLRIHVGNTCVDTAFTALELNKVVVIGGMKKLSRLVVEKKHKTLLKRHLLHVTERVAVIEIM